MITVANVGLHGYMLSPTANTVSYQMYRWLPPLILERSERTSSTDPYVANVTNPNLPSITSPALHIINITK
jgi:hypothetical protein